MQNRSIDRNKINFLILRRQKLQCSTAVAQKMFAWLQSHQQIRHKPELLWGPYYQQN